MDRQDVVNLIAAATNDTAEKLADICPKCCCETTMSFSKYSPGIVENKELVCRICVDPIFWNSEKGTPLPDAFFDISKKGMSVWREEHLKAGELEKLENDRVNAKPGRRKGGIVRCSVSALREGVMDGQRAFCIYDTASEDTPAHADIFQAFFHPPAQTNRKLLGKRMRVLIYRIFTNQRTDFFTPPPPHPPE